MHAKTFTTVRTDGKQITADSLFFRLAPQPNAIKHGDAHVPALKDADLVWLRGPIQPWSQRQEGAVEQQEWGKAAMGLEKGKCVLLHPVPGIRRHLRSPPLSVCPGVLVVGGACQCRFDLLTLKSQKTAGLARHLATSRVMSIPVQIMSLLFVLIRLSSFLIRLVHHLVLRSRRGRRGKCRRAFWTMSLLLNLPQISSGLKCLAKRLHLQRSWCATVG